MHRFWNRPGRLNAKILTQYLLLPVWQKILSNTFLKWEASLPSSPPPNIQQTLLLLLEGFSRLDIWGPMFNLLSAASIISGPIWSQDQGNGFWIKALQFKQDPLSGVLSTPAARPGEQSESDSVAGWPPTQLGSNTLALSCCLPLEAPVLKDKRALLLDVLGMLLNLNPIT